MSLTVHVWSDVVCPWCFVGSRRLEQAVAEFGQEVDVVWHSFELDPTRPKQSAQSPAEHLAKKYGMPVARAVAMMDQMTATGKKEGINFKLQGAKTKNTFDAHRLLHLAKESGLGGNLKRRLFQAHFEEEVDCSDPQELLRLATEVGLDSDKAAAVLFSDQYATAVRQDEEAARDLGITGVPFFVVGRYGISGAQSHEVLLRALDQANVDEEASFDEGAACVGPDC